MTASQDDFALEEMLPENKAALERFVHEMTTPDELTHVLLKGHLLLEEAITRIIEAHCFHPEHLAEARLSFYQKINMVRSFCLRKSQLGEWDLMLAINALRNDLAHNLSTNKREARYARVVELYDREGNFAKKDLSNVPKAEIVMKACAHCIGFLGTFESDAKALRRYIHGIDRVLNPDLPPFEL